MERPWDLLLAAATGGLLVFLGMRQRRQSVRRVATSLQAAWKPKQKQPPPFAPEDTLTLHPEDLPSQYQFFISAYVPRPIALVSSISSEGVGNLAPFSYSAVVSHDPGVLLFSCVDKGKGGGDTLKNVLSTGQFIVHVMSEWYLEAANHCSGNFGPEVDELHEAGLTPVPGVVVKASRVAEAAVAFECELLDSIPIRNAKDKVGTTVVLGTVKLVHVSKHVFHEESGTIVPEKLRPMARLGGNTYSLLGDIFDLSRPKVGP